MKTAIIGGSRAATLHAAYMAAAFNMVGMVRADVPKQKPVEYVYNSVGLPIVISKVFNADNVANRKDFCRMSGVPYEEMVKFVGFEDTKHLYVTKI